MIRFSDYLTQDVILLGLKPTDKTDLLVQLARHVGVKHHHLDDQEVLKRLVDRERQSTTGVGGGIAIPHASMDEVDKSILMFARVANGVAFDALDGGLVDLVFLVLSPTQNRSEHIRLLARIARTLCVDGLATGLREASCEEEVLALLVAQDEG